MIEFEQFGTGPNRLIGLHGWFGDQTTFRPLELSLDPDRFHCVWLAHRGYGASKSISGAYTMDEMATDTLEVADHLGWSTFSVIGHSMGGKAAQLLAARAPDRVSKLIAVASAPANPVPFDSLTRQFFDAVANDPVSRRGVINQSTGNRLSPVWVEGLVDQSIARTTPEVQSAYLKSWADDDLVPEVQGCRVDTLVIAGAHDPVITPEVCELVIRTRFPHSQIQTMADSGHYPMEETPLALGAAVASFLH